MAWTKDIRGNSLINNSDTPTQNEIRQHSLIADPSLTYNEVRENAVIQPGENVGLPQA